jgi:hypothetical protein
METTVMPPTDSSSAPSTITIHRPHGTSSSLRVVSDEAAVVCVVALAFSEIKTLAGSPALAVPADYLLTNDEQRKVYVGESHKVGKRLLGYPEDPQKNFATEVVFLMGRDRSLTKNKVIYFQSRLIALVKEAGSYSLANTAPACEASVTPEETASLEGMLTQAMPLFRAAHCKVFDRPLVAPPAKPPTPAAAADRSQTADSGTPQHFDLNYRDIWARGFPSGKEFVVAAGSNIRIPENPSIDDPV